MQQYRVIELNAPEAISAFGETVLYQEFAPSSLTAHASDRHFAVIDANGEPQARCSLWWREVPALGEQTLGAIGHYAAASASASSFLLHHVCSELKRRGCSVAVGPMDGNTWRSYRLVTSFGNEPPFFMEPTNPASWPEYWQQAGFSSVACYSSGLSTDLSQRDERLPRVKRRLDAAGVSLRPLNVSEFNDELRRIFVVSLQSFKKNYLYTPIAEEEFVEKYRALQSLIMPDLVLIAEDENRVVGFLLGVPDINEKRRGEPLRTVIIKTVAVLPGSRFAGLGALMVDSAQQNARMLGMSRAVHALMHDANSSRNISSHYGSTMRRYALFIRRL